MAKIDRNLNLIEVQELIHKLSQSGFSELVEAFLLNENKVYTKKGRLNKSGACRILKWKSKQLEEALLKCQEILFNDVKDNVE
jgi:hypothetical protein